MEETLEEKEKYPSFGGSGSGQCSGYTIEGRFNHNHAQEVLGQLFDNRWQQIYFKKGPIGVPIKDGLHPFLYEIHLYNWQAAQALRWWFHAALEMEPLGDLCFETRIVEHKVIYSYKTEAMMHHDNIGGDNAPSSRGPRKPKIAE